mmetsp:Transcript_23783/g.65822  ORF Transcript_23783/g.65822 Transcript_23783/m.65822 type:complete len:269 (-) Transcript_23783:287-1093(-)|eukprot:scaffold156354_cov33-Tisochrysis_lutea.AAC.1
MLGVHVALVAVSTCVPPGVPLSQRLHNVQAAARLQTLGFERAVPQSAATLSSKRRDIVVCCHGTPDPVVRGRFNLNNLPTGRVDLLARCASSALFLSHGVRRNTRLWLVFQDHEASVCINGQKVRGLHPDERTIAAALKRTLAVAHGATGRADSDDGWSFHSGGLAARLDALMSDRGCEPKRLIQLHEAGEIPLRAALHPDANHPVEYDDVVLVFGDQLGFTVKESKQIAQRGGVQAHIGPASLLTSHCIVLAHHACDTASEPVFAQQ